MKKGFSKILILPLLLSTFYFYSCSPEKSPTIPATTQSVTPISGNIQNTPSAQSDVTSIKNIAELITQKCAYCHSKTPNSSSGYTKAPKNITFDSVDEMNTNIKLIKNVVAEKTMPIGSITLTDDEISLVSKWKIKKIAAPSPSPNTSGSQVNASGVDIKTVSPVITQKCAYCHSKTPNSSSGYTKAPVGLTFDTEDDISSNIKLIKKVVAEKTMPIGNITLTSAEITMLSNWSDVSSSSSIIETPTPTPSSINSTPTPVPSNTSTTNVKDVITQKCAYCHSKTPNSASGYTNAPRSITFDSESEINDKMSIIRQAAIVDKSMPIGSMKLTNEEIDLIDKWSAPNYTPPPVLKTATEIMKQKCTYCHSKTPDPSSGLTKPPKSLGGIIKGLTFDTEQEMINDFSDINKVITNRTMPINNITLTNEERNVILKWCEDQKAIEAQKPIYIRVWDKLF